MRRFDMSLFSIGRAAFAVSFVAEIIGVHVRKAYVDSGVKTSICGSVDHHCCTWNHPPESTDHTRSNQPMVIFSGGCAGSSAALEMAKYIAEKSNHHVLDCDGGFELLADISKGFYGKQHMNLSATVHDFIVRADKLNRHLLFKAEQRFAEDDPRLMHYLLGLKAKFVNFQRWNKLDVALCSVHDCFQNFTPKPFGFQVNDHGEHADNCGFRGRGSNETHETHKVFVNTTNLVMNLKQLHKSNEWAATFLQGFEVPYQVAVYEDLFRFNNGGATDFTSSVHSWKGFMRSLGVNSETSVIAEYLRTLQGEHAPPPKHSEVIANFDEVKSALEHCSGPVCKHLRKMLRE